MKRVFVETGSYRGDGIQNEIIAAVMLVNLDYRIYYEDGYVRNDVLVAKVCEE